MLPCVSFNLSTSWLETKLSVFNPFKCSTVNIPKYRLLFNKSVCTSVIKVKVFNNWVLIMRTLTTMDSPKRNVFGFF